jgi:predicted dinucleotide-binding enzyme
LLRSIGNGASTTWEVVETFKTIGVEALEPVAHSLRMKAKVTSDCRDAGALAGLPDHLCSFDEACLGGARMGQALNHLLFFRR